LSDTQELHTEGGAQGATPTGRREAGKTERKQRIIRAARQLIRETGNAGLSMRALAVRAGVSLATPYNLFGSKRAIVLAVLEDVREFQHRFSSVQSVDPLERIFSAVDIAMDFYLGDPTFYKTLWAAVFDTGDEVRDAILNPARHAFWQGLLDDAAAAGVLAPALDRTLLGRHLDSLFRAVMLDWVVGDIRPEALAATARMGYALILKGACSSEWRGPLQARILESQAVVLAAQETS
jgi:AcrR family transcriptional regulator